MKDDELMRHIDEIASNIVDKVLNDFDDALKKATSKIIARLMKDGCFHITYSCDYSFASVSLIPNDKEYFEIIKTNKNYARFLSGKLSRG